MKPHRSRHALPSLLIAGAVAVGAPALTQTKQESADTRQNGQSHRERPALRSDGKSAEERLCKPREARVTVVGRVKAATDQAFIPEYGNGKGHVVVEVNGGPWYEP